MMGRRRQDDVFVIGEEALPAAATTLLDPAAPDPGQEPVGYSQPAGLGSPVEPPRRGRPLAALAVGAGTVASAAVLASSLGGSGGSQGPSTSPRSAAILPSRPSPADPPAPGRPPLHPAPPRPRHARHGATTRVPSDTDEPVREPTPMQAPASSSPPIAYSPAPPPAPVSATTPPTPPPPPGGGGTGGTEHFGFER